MRDNPDHGFGYRDEEGVPYIRIPEHSLIILKREFRRPEDEPALGKDLPELKDETTTFHNGTTMMIVNVTSKMMLIVSKIRLSRSPFAALKFTVIPPSA